MAGRNGDYPNSKVGLEQGAERFFQDSDGYYNAAGNDIDGNEMKYQLYDAIQKTTIGQGATSTKLSVVNLPADVQLVILSMTSTTVEGSFWLTSALQGRTIILRQNMGSTASGSIVISTSGCSIVGLTGSDVSVIHLINSTNSTGMITLKTFTDNEWTVVDVGDGVSM